MNNTEGSGELDMEEKILSVQYPILNSYPSIAISSAIIMNNSKYKTWIASSYLIIREINKRGQIKYFLEESEIDNPVIKIVVNIGQLTPHNVVDFIKNSIDKDNYCKCYYDRFYINSNKGHFLHSCFIYGYDKENFYCGDFVGEGGKFDFFIMPQKLYIESFRYCKFSLFVNYINLNEVYLYHLNSSMLDDFQLKKTVLVELLNNRYIECHNFYILLSKYYINYNKIKWLDWRPFAVLKDYVTAMEIRFKEVQKNFAYGIELDYLYLSRMREIIDNTLFLFLLNTKKKNDEYLMAIQNNLDELERIDRYNIEYLLKILGE